MCGSRKSWGGFLWYSLVQISPNFPVLGTSNEKKVAVLTNMGGGKQICKIQENLFVLKSKLMLNLFCLG